MEAFRGFLEALGGVWRLWETVLKLEGNILGLLNLFGSLGRLFSKNLGGLWRLWEALGGSGRLWEALESSGRLLNAFGRFYKNSSKTVFLDFFCNSLGLTYGILTKSF